MHTHTHTPINESVAVRFQLYLVLWALGASLLIEDYRSFRIQQRGLKEDFGIKTKLLMKKSKQNVIEGRTGLK